ncbi:MAG: hypothetical protein K6A23_04600 [Butyrivibrio sp.]|nr:hypothetical protein [Butyrivibrio sp.]
MKIPLYLFKKNTFFSILVIIEVILLLFSVFLLFRPSYNVTLNTDSMTTEAGIYMESFPGIENSGYYLDNANLAEGETTTITTNPVDIPFGSYIITMHYSNSDNQNRYTASSTFNTYQVLTGTQNIGLETGENLSTEILLSSPIDVDGYYITFTYGGNGYLFLSDITIAETHDFKYILLFSVIVLSIILNILYFKFKKWDSMDKIAVVAIVCVTFFVSCPLFTYFIGDGHDCMSHIDRIAAVAQTIKNQFPVRLSSFWNNGYGYAFSIFYNDIFLYVPAFFRLLGFTIQDSYKLYVILINLFTCIIAYYSFKNIFRSKKAGIIAMALYALSPYRLICLYLRCAAGEYTAQTFYPLILYGIYKIYMTEPFGKENKGKALLKKELSVIMPLIAGLCGIVSCHILSCIMATFFIVLTCLVMWKKTFKKVYFLRLLSSAVITFVINSWYIIPLLDFYRDSYEVSTRNTSGRFAANGAFFWQLLNPLPDGTGMSYSIAESYGYTDESSYAVGLYFIIGIILLICIYIYNKNIFKNNNLLKICFSLSILTFFMSGYGFIWDFIQQFGSIMSMLTQSIQFPWRFIGPFALFATVVCIEVLLYFHKNHEKYLISVTSSLLLLAIISAGFFLNSSCRSQEWRLLLTESDLTTDAIGTGEYLPVNTDTHMFWDNISTVAFSDDTVSIQNAYRGSDIITVEASNNSGAKSYIDVAFLYYRYYKAIDNSTGVELETEISPENRIRVILPSDYTGSFSVFFREPVLWRLSELVTIISLLAIIAIYLPDIKLKLFKPLTTND